MFIQNFITKTLHNAKLRIKKKIHFKVNYRRILVVKPQWEDEHTPPLDKCLAVLLEEHTLKKSIFQSQ